MVDDGSVNPRSYSTYLKTRPASWYELFILDTRFLGLPSIILALNLEEEINS